MAADARGVRRMNELHWLPAVEAARRIAAGELSPVELVGALLDRIDRIDPALHSVVRVDREAAMQEARNAEAEARRVACGHRLLRARRHASASRGASQRLLVLAARAGSDDDLDTTWAPVGRAPPGIRHSP